MCHAANKVENYKVINIELSPKLKHAFVDEATHKLFLHINVR